MRQTLVAGLVALCVSSFASAADLDALLFAARTDDRELLKSLLADGEKVEIPNYHSSYSPLQFSAGNGDAEGTRLLIAAGLDTEYRDHNGDRALLWAAENGHAETVKLLLDAGSLPDSDDDPYGTTPIMKAARYGHVEVVRLLLAAGADVHRRGQAEETALQVAALTDSAEMIRLLLEAGANPNSFDDILLETPLHNAAVWSTREVVELLLDAGAAPMPRNHEGKTPLHLAAITGHTDIVAALLQQLSRVDVRDDGRQTPLLAAIAGMSSYPDTAENAALLLAERSDDLDRGLVAALRQGSWPISLRLLERGADPNSVDDLGDSAFGAAVHMPGLTFLQLLLSKGADLQTHGPDALAKAAAGRVDVVGWLLDKGVPIESRDAGGATPFLHAARSGSVEVARLLLERGADPDAVDKLGDGMEDYMTVEPAMLDWEIAKREASRAWRPTEDLRLQRDDLAERHAAIRALVAVHKR